MPLASLSADLSAGSNNGLSVPKDGFGSLTQVSEVHHISAATRDRLHAELADLTGRGRIDIAEQIETARLLGDLSENGDYHAAKEEQGKMEGRIMRLKSILENCEIVADVDDKFDSSTVAPGLIVSIRFEATTNRAVSLRFNRRAQNRS